MDTKLKISASPSWMSRVTGKPISKPKSAPKPATKLPKGVKMAPKPKPNSYMGP